LKQEIHELQKKILSKGWMLKDTGQSSAFDSKLSVAPPGGAGSSAPGSTGGMGLADAMGCTHRFGIWTFQAQSGQGDLRKQ